MVGFFGSAHPPSRVRKGVDSFIQSSLELQKQIPELLLFICGQNWDDDVDLLREHGLRVFHPSFLSSARMPAAYRALDVFVVASTIEGGPVTAFEAMASGVPLVSTSVGMVRDAVTPKQDAIIMPANQPDELAEAVLRLYEDSALNERLRQNGVSLVQNHYQWAHVAPRYGDLYRLLMGQQRGSWSGGQVHNDPFVQQRKEMLREDFATLILLYWKQGHKRAAINIYLFDLKDVEERINVILLVIKRQLYRLCSRFFSWPLWITGSRKAAR